MSHLSLAQKRVLITQADTFMGPVLCEVLTEHGATVLANADPLISPEAPARIIAEAGQVDILIANLGIPAPATAAVEVSEQEWKETFAALVDPLPRICVVNRPIVLSARSFPFQADG
ncbi:MAG: hypothetical protein AB7I41_18725 [Candidatus Sericytochromatia bacterium]